jgi:hypothetical protein
MDKAVKATILDILSKQTDMTIATLREDQYPQATTVSYVNDSLDIYFGCSTRSQKAQNIARHNKISLTVTPSYTDWNSIRGLSIGGLAERVIAPSQVTSVEALFFRKFPFVVQYAPENREDLAFYKIVPKVFSVLDYTKSFGHTDLVTIDA